MDAANVLKIVELKVSQLESLQSVGMTWWASSCVLCASIIAAVWRHGQFLKQDPLINLLRFALGGFFVTIVVFGSLMTMHVYRMSKYLRSLQSEIADAVVPDFQVTAVSYAVATSTFVLVTFAWFALVRYLRSTNSSTAVATKGS